MTFADPLSIDANIRFRRVGADGVVVDQRNAEVMVVSEVAVRILELIRETGSLERVQAAIVAEYEVPQDQAISDLNQFLDELSARSMVIVETVDVSL